MLTKLNKPYILLFIGLLLGVLLGTSFFSGGSGSSESTSEAAAAADVEYTCSMHPQIRQQGPGLCPICGMELIPMETEGSGMDPNRIRMSAIAIQLADIRTTRVESSQGATSWAVDGKIYPDERRIYAQTAHVAGRIEALGVDFTGAFVRKGEVIAHIYAPELVTAQREIIEAKKVMNQQPELYQAAINRLKNWKFTSAQIFQVLQSNQAIESFPILSDITGFVSHKHIRVGDHVQEGQQLYEIQDLKRVWALFDLYEDQLSQAAVGDTIAFEVAALKGQEFKGVIRYLDPVLGMESRAIKARVEIDNPNNQLKPEMFVRGTLQAASETQESSLSIPKSAVLWTGKRSVVYVKEQDEEGIYFHLREVEIGADFGSTYEILSGIETDEEVAYHGAFSIDAAAQLAGKNSMMQNTSSMEPHEHTVEKVEIAVVKTPLKGSVRDQFDQLLLSYLSLKDALTLDDFEASIQYAKDFHSLGEKFLAEDSDEPLQEHKDYLKEVIMHLHHSADMEALREQFLGVSDLMIAMLRSYGVGTNQAYIQFCPMANNNSGAFWISVDEEIKNPYFGASMLMCGSVEETIAAE